MRKSYVPTEKLLSASQGSVYKLTVLAAKRAMQLADGEKTLLEKPGNRVLDSALREIAQKKIKVKTKEKGKDKVKEEDEEKGKEKAKEKKSK